MSSTSICLEPEPRIRVLDTELLFIVSTRRNKNIDNLAIDISQEGSMLDIRREVNNVARADPIYLAIDNLVTISFNDDHYLFLWMGMKFEHRTGFHSEETDNSPATFYEMAGGTLNQSRRWYIVIRTDNVLLPIFHASQLKILFSHFLFPFYFD